MAVQQGEHRETDPQEESRAADLLRPLLSPSLTTPATMERSPAVAIGELVGLNNGGQTPVVLYPGPDGPIAVTACTVLDLYGPQIGRRVLLMFEDAEPTKPIVVGVLRDDVDSTLQSTAQPVEVHADGGRLIVSAKEQLILRCGQASITLTKSGKVLIEGAYVSTRSSGVNRIKGGAVQIN